MPHIPPSVPALVSPRALGESMWGKVEYFAISTSHPVTFVGVPTVRGLAALLANYPPARRATRIDPMRALRVE